MSLVFFIFFCLNFGRVCSVADVTADTAAIICASPSPKVLHNDLQGRFSFNTLRFVARWRCGAAT
jgi:hypothetical protein